METFDHHAGLDGYGGASDVDSVLMRRGQTSMGLSTGTPQTRFDQDGSQRWYVLQNWRQDVVAIIDEAAVQRERVFYSGLLGALRLGGRVFGPLPDNPAGDTGFDGDYGAGDSSAISGWAMAGDPYRAYADVDLDGDIDGTDATYSTNVGLGWDELSRDGSTIGYAGYVQDDFISTLSHVRHRVYKSDLGRWVQRDPLGYIDGPNVYEYAMSRPHILIDPMGLASQTGGCGLGGAGGVGVDSCGGRVGAVLGWWKKPVKKLTSCLECAQQLREAAENMDFNSEQCIGCCDTYACRSCRSDPWVPRPGDTHAECVSDCSICCHKWKCVGINDLWRRLPDCIECALDIDDDRFEEYFEGDIARCHPDQFGQELRCGPLLRAKLLRCKDRKAWETGCD